MEHLRAKRQIFFCIVILYSVISQKSGWRDYKAKKCFQCSPERWLRKPQTAAEVQCSLFRCVFIRGRTSYTASVFFKNKIAAGKQKNYIFRLFPETFSHILYIRNCVFWIPGHGKFFLSQKSGLTLGPPPPPPSILFYGYRGYFLGVKREGVTLTAHLNLVPCWRMIAALRTFMICTRSKLPI